MRTIRRNFDKDCKAAMARRATDEKGQLRCEGCQRALKKSEAEYDHVIAEGLRPDEDKKRKLTPADGQVLGRDCCHRGEGSKTSDDQSKIAKAKRGESNHLGIRDAPKMQSRGFSTTPKAAARKQKASEKIQPPGLSGIYRRIAR